MNSQSNSKSKRNLYAKLMRNLGLFSFCLVPIFCVSFVRTANAANASLYLSPSTGTVFVGSTFDVSIFVNTAKNNINAIKVDLKFDPTKLQIASPTTGKSFISVWAVQPSFSNTEGTASFTGGLPSPGINTNAGLISTITFRATAPGKTTISILDSSQVLLNDGKGSNILGSAGSGIFEITIPPPEGPKIHSASHPDPNKWYKNNNPSFDWEKEEDVTDFSYSIDQSPYSTPDNTPEGDRSSVSYSDLTDGLWYFHLKAKRGDVWGGVSHYLIQIDNTPPAAFTVKIEPTLKTPLITTKKPIASFMTTDAHSGLEHYVIKIIGFTKGEKESSLFFEAISPYRLPIEDTGEYEIIVRAYDQAGNWQDISKKIEIVDSVRLFYSSKQGLGILGLFLFWWQLILVVIVLIIIVFLFIWWWRKKHLHVDEQKKILEELKVKIAANEQEIRKKLGNPQQNKT